ncbi:Mbeg1-like protein [Paenibacillus alginolyticus]|uniref:DUF2974 domain-containing protein n=1 Tax=Paenibacillus alginolyticus TaxID=59839 RepID=A0ABT4G7A0_9BACL|nr:Mbeg1-like protein [Paenibacillus alginolyticus]MCY9692051.1 DUF2974 domain-containing protein [Paenibacillus alginolyticus]MEC0144241.1 DUF2974 domain-containing protein [Paenibacillus alginolyticus]
MGTIRREEYALLSDFSYIDLPDAYVKRFFNVNNKHNSLEEGLHLLLNQYEDQLSSKQIEIVNQMLNSPELCKLTFKDYENKDSRLGNNAEKIKQKGSDITGFAAMGFIAHDGIPIAVFRGSEPLTEGNKDALEDWYDNLKNMLLGNESTQYDQAEQFYKSLKGDYEGQSVVVGHSKGGNLAAYIASTIGDCEGYLFNPMPLHKNYVHKDNLNNMHTYVAEHDFIASLLTWFSPEEIRKLLLQLSPDEFTELVLGGFPVVKAKIAIKINEILGKSPNFNTNFDDFRNNNDIYYYPGQVEVIPNEYNPFTGVLKAHSMDNFKRNYYPTIDIQFESIASIVSQLNRINSQLESIDNRLDSLLRNIVIDYNPLHIPENIINSFKVAIADSRIGKSIHISNCVSWLTLVESEFRVAEARLVNQADQILNITLSPGSSNVAKFK